MKHGPKNKKEQRTRRHARVRAKVAGSPERPRLAIYKSNKFVSAQLIDDAAGKTLAQAHGREFKGAKAAQAVKVGEEIAKRAKKIGVSAVIFDRAGYRYASQVKALAEAARAGGLTF